MTLSITAYDPEALLLGCAVTSCAVAAGRRILHARPGVGVAVAQASSLLRWGEDLLDSVAAGLSASDAVEQLARPDNQLAVVTAAGGTAVHTGAACPPHAGHRAAAGFSAQANLAALDDAWERMATAFRGSTGPLAERLVAALAASGGDARGGQGAAVIVTGATAGDEMQGTWDEPHVDLRVDDHREPVAELARLLALHRAHGEMRRVAELSPKEQLKALKPLAAAHKGDPHLERAVARAREAGG